MKHFFVAAAFLMSLLSTRAYAAHPLITDDTGTQGMGCFQFELAAEYGHEKEYGITGNTFDLSAAMSYGVVHSVDIVLSLPYSSWRSEEAGTKTSESGISDISLEAKWRFYDKDGLSFAFKPGITFPTGDDEKGLGNGRSTYYLLFITSKVMAPWALHLNLAYKRNDNTAEDRKDIFHGSIASTYEVTKGLKLAGDIGLETNPDPESSDSPAYILGGLIYSPSQNLDFSLGLKGGLTKPETDISVRGGVTYRF